MVMEEEVKRWTAKRKAALVTEIQGKTTIAEASRAFDMPPSEIEEWADEAKPGMGHALRASRWICASNMSARSRSCRKPR